MPLDPQVKALLKQLTASGTPPWYTLPIVEARNRTLLTAMALRGELEPVRQIEDREIPGIDGKIRLRIYTPEDEGPLPILMYCHGGGWTMDSVETHDTICCTLANVARCIVVSVDYRLAPEHRFPAALEDSYIATRWVADNASDIVGDPKRIAVGGNSAGGNLAAAVALMARDRGGPQLVYQLLVYPILDYYLPSTPSYLENAEGYFLTSESIMWFWRNYLPREADASNPYAAPLHAKELRGLPPALVITAEFDPLRDEGEQYAARLKEAGVPVVARRYNGMIHGFFNMAGKIDQGKRAQVEAATALRTAFESVSKSKDAQIP